MEKMAFRGLIWACLLALATPVLGQIQVWPGDANRDGKVSTVDVLYLGVGYNTQGIARDTQGIAWRQLSVNPWVSVLPGNVNYGHLDCDGNGFINENDLSAVRQNYGFTHSNMVIDSFPEPDSTSPIFYMVGSFDSLSDGDTAVIEIYVGSEDIPASFFGVAFAFQYDTLFVRRNSVRIEADPIVNTSTQRLLELAVNDPENGIFDVAFSRRANSGGTLGIPILLAGQRMATISFIIEDNLIGKTADTLALKLMDIKLMDRNLRKSSAPEYRLVVPFGGIVAVAETPLEEQFRIYPIPTQDVLVIDAMRQNGLYILTDLSGKAMAQGQIVADTKTFVDCAHFATGMYLLTVQTEGGKAVKKVLIE